jgi:hypothetical protein
MTRRIHVVLVAAAIALTSANARAVCDSTAGNATAEIFAEYCEPNLGYIGCCFGTEAFWCETSFGQQYTCKIECASAQYCGWNTEQGYYFCGTEGSSDPSQENPLTCPDADGDSWHLGGDCDDSEATVYPFAPQECDDGLDNDCDPEPDSNEADADGDGYSECDGDCNDALPEFNPGAEDECGDGYDHDCSGDVDDEIDDDGDGIPECAGDCDDTDASVHEGADELCGDGLDNDCDSEIDEGCGTPGDDDDDDGGDDDDETMVTPRAGPYGLGCAAAPNARGGLPVTLTLLLLGWMARRRA